MYDAALWKEAVEEDLGIMRESTISMKIPAQPNQPNKVELSMIYATSLQLIGEPAWSWRQAEVCWNCK